MSNKDYYAILGIEKNASDSDIKKAFRKLAAQYHPDKQVGKSDEEKKDAEAKFKEVNEAYQILSDKDKKEKYDRFGTVDDMGGGWSGEAPDDIFEMFRHMHDGMFGGGFNGGFNEQVQVNGEPCVITVDCTLEDIYKGVSKTYKYKRKVKCKECNGSGSSDGKVDKCAKCNGSGKYRDIRRGPWGVSINEGLCPDCYGAGKSIKNKCKNCGGTGLETITDTITFDIPKEVRDGAQMPIRGKGNEAPNNLGQAGDLIIRFRVKRHDIFGIDQNGVDLYCKTNINVLDCITGTEKQIKCIDGSTTTIKIPQGTKENSKVVVKGKGMPNRFGFGNMIVYINQVMPTNLNKDEIEIIETLKTKKHFKND